MDNWINFDNLPRNSQNRIAWKDCNHNLVTFCYRNNLDSFYVEERVDEDNVLVNFHDKDIVLQIQSIKHVCLGKLYNFAVKNNYHYSTGDRIQNQGQQLIVLDQIRINYSNGKSSKGYKVQCLDCDYIFEVSEANLDRGDGCPVCSNHQVVIGINDLWHTRPDVAKMLKNPDDGYHLTQFSNQEADFICPKCGASIGKSYVYNVSKIGLSCHNCGDGITYPNKLIANVLTLLDEDFDTEIVFDWCKFPDFYDDQKISYGRYDVVVENKKLIIEMDGGFGHGKNPHPFSRYTKEELIYKDQMKDKLAIENGYQIVRIDCDYSSHNRLEYCSNSIMNSHLSDFYDFSQVNWQHINEMCA